MPPQAPAEGLELSVVAPARDERENLCALVEEVERALRPLGACFELIVVDDGSSDGTRQELHALLPKYPWLRALAPDGTAPGRGLGQSAALGVGYRAARGRRVASLDADLQNDPADLLRLLRHLDESGVDLVQGDRSAVRSDGALRRFGSWVGRSARRIGLGDPVRDTGCSLRVLSPELARQLPLEIAGMHRFVPVLAQQLGYRVAELPVGHRPRRAGAAKYGVGLGRALPGLIDLLGVRWLGWRRRPLGWEEVER